MEISMKTVDEVEVVALSGDIDGSNAPAVQEQIMPLVHPECRILLDMSGVSYMSSAGLRMLLSTYRQISRQSGRIALVGLAEEIKDTMAVTGFLDFFTTCDTIEEGVKALQIQSA